MKDVSQKTLGGMMRRARLRMGWSLRDAAKATGIPHSWLTRVEQGHYSRPAPHRLARVAEVLGLDLRQLNQATGGSLADGLPTAEMYFRTKYDLTPSEIAKLEAVLAQVRHERDSGQPNG